MTTMKAVRYHSYGGPDVLRYEDADKPTAAPGEMLVRVKAAAVNPVDWKIRKGLFAAMHPAQFPVTPGADMSGVVEELGERTTGFQVGDAVFAYIPGGGYAEYATFDASAAALKPKSISFVEAASLPVAALTAWQALFDAAHLQAGQTVLIHGAAGGVGSLAVQIAKWKGATVVGTASASNQAYLRELGVDQPIDYSAGPFERGLHDIDVILDTLGGDTQARSWGVLAPNGVLVSLVDPTVSDTGKQKGKRGLFYSSHASGAQLKEVAKLADEGVIKPQVDTVLPLADARKAQEQSESGHTRGKIVLQVSE